MEGHGDASPCLLGPHMGTQYLIGAGSLGVFGPQRCVVWSSRHCDLDHKVCLTDLQLLCHPDSTPDLGSGLRPHPHACGLKTLWGCSSSALPCKNVKEPGWNSPGCTQEGSERCAAATSPVRWQRPLLPLHPPPPHHLLPKSEWPANETNSEINLCKSLHSCLA